MVYIYAFLTCGTLCLAGQLIYDNTKLTAGHITSLFVVIGAALDAKIELFCQDELYTFVKSVEGELKDVCIVSQAEVKNTGEGEYKGEAVPGLSVTVSHTEGEKCARCWSYTHTVGTCEKHPDLCSRCAEVLG